MSVSMNEDMASHFAVGSPGIVYLKHAFQKGN